LHPPSTKKIKIELQDDDGDKYNVSLQGKFSKEKMLKVFELIESFDNKSLIKKTNIEHQHEMTNLHSTLGSRLWNIIQDKLIQRNFTSSQVLNFYNDIYNQRIQLSIVSTYLARFFARNKLTRIKHGKEWMYSIANLNHNITNRHSDYLLHSNDLLHHYEKPSTVYDLRQ
jgi:hypothetical protein